MIRSFSSKFGIDWSKVTKRYYSSSYPALYSMQATASSNYLFLLLRVKSDFKENKMVKGHAYDNELSVFIYDSSNGSKRYWNDQKSTRVDALGGWLLKNSKPQFVSWNSSVSSQVVTYDGYYYYEIRYPRSLSSLLKGSSLKIGVRMENNYQRSDGSYASSSNVSAIGILPSKGSDMYSVGSSSTSNDKESSTSTHCSSIGTTPMVMAYVPSYSSCPTSDDAKKLTHINYFGYKTDKYGNLSNDDDDVTISDVMNLKKYNSSLKVLLTIGGAEGASNFSSMANSSSRRETFCEACSTLVYKYGLDGVDLDWEHPSGSTDMKNFNLLLADLRGKLTDKKIISMAASSTPKYIDWTGSEDTGTEGAMTYLDYVNVMTYDMSWPSSGEEYLNHHSALYPSSTKHNTTKSDSDGYYHSCSSVVKAYKNAGVPVAKQNLGVAFYGHGTSNYDPEQSGRAFRKVSSTVIKNSSWDDKGMVPFYYKSSSDYLGYENEKSVNLKGQYAKLNSLLGVMFWEYGHDSSSKLLKALYNGVKGKDKDGNKSSNTTKTLPL